MGEGLESTGGKARRGRPPKQRSDNPTNNTTENGSGDQSRSGLEGIKIGEEEGVSGLAAVKQTIPETGEKKGRGRPFGSTSSKAAPSTNKAASKQHDFLQTQSMVQTMLSVSFGIGSMRLGEHWQLAPHEAAAIAEPITAILDRYDLTKLTGKYGDWIALCTALGIVFTPRIMHTMQLAKQKGGNQNVRLQGVPNVRQPAAAPRSAAVPEANTANGDSGQVQAGSSTDGGHGLKQSLAHFG